MKIEEGAMILSTSLHYTFEKLGNIGVFAFSGKLTGHNKNDLEALLMRAIHSLDRAVLNFKSVSKIEHSCLNLLKMAYVASLRMKNPLILTEVPGEYQKELMSCEMGNIHMPHVDKGVTDNMVEV